MRPWSYPGPREARLSSQPRALFCPGESEFEPGLKYHRSAVMTKMKAQSLTDLTRMAAHLERQTQPARQPVQKDRTNLGQERVGALGESARHGDHEN